MEIKRDVYLDKLIRVSVYQGSQDEAWDDYLVYGGLPLILTMEEAEDKADGKRGKKQLEVNFVATKGSEEFSAGRK